MGVGVTSAEGSGEPARTGPGEDRRFVTVGVGASAGGLEAVTALLQSLDVERLAVVVVQHLGPQAPSALPALLAKVTKAPVVEAADGMKVQPGHVYVNAPGADLALLQGALHLMAPPNPPGGLAIDYFLRSLAADAGSLTAGVVLSGTGSDGTFGLKAIKEAGGITFAQDPSTAKFDGMPRSASESGWADFTLPAGAIAHELARLSRQPSFVARDPLQGTAPQEQLGKLIVMMRGAFGNDLTCYKPTTIERRVERRMALHKIERLDAYVRYVAGNPNELKLLYRDMLISVTSFFRDVEPFDFVRERVFPRILEHKDVGSQIRVWVPACSTGEEAYSYAITLLEHLGDRAQDYRIQIFGTDVDAAAIAHARRGCYPLNIALDVSPERLHRFFVKKDGELQIARRIRDMVVFSVQNVTKDPPFSRLDLASCRNLLIYLQPQAQQKVLRVLHYSLVPNGHLVLGTSETVGESSELFSLADRKAKVYTKKHGASLTTLDTGTGVQSPGPPRPIQPGVGHRAANISSLAERKILELFGPPGVVINDDLEVVHIRGRTAPFLEPMPGAPSFNILMMARPDLHADLRRAIHEAQSKGARVSIDSRVSDGGVSRPFRLEVVPILDADTNARCMMVLFHGAQTEASLAPVPPPEAATPEAQRIRELERELSITKEYLQSTIEKLESGSEALRSSNEELQSSNEELQSMNEELETSKVELQSANEELTTLNDELQNRMTELQQSNDDLYNVLAGVGNAVVIIGMDLRIRRYTHTAEKMLNLVQGDVGRSVSQLNGFVQGTRVEELAADVIARLVPASREVQGADGRWYELNVSPYRTLDHSIKGALVVLIDIDGRKKTSAVSRGITAYADDLYRLTTYPLAIIDRERHFVWVNAAFGRRFEVPREQAVRSPLARIVGDSWLETLLERAFNDGADFRNFEVKGLKVSGSRIPPIGGDNRLVLLSFEDSGVGT